MVSMTSRLQLHVLVCFGTIDSQTLAKKAVEVESPHLLAVRRESAAGLSENRARCI